MKHLSKSAEETSKIAGDFLKKIFKTKSDKATIVGLFGDLGSGKTTFTQALGKCLGVKEVITSPTFVIMKSYSLKPNSLQLKANTLFHIDAYRLDSGKELANLGFNEISQDPNNLILIEWPERVADIMPADLIKINFKFIGEFEREVEI